MITVIFTADAAAQVNRFDGYSFTLDADESGSCPVKYMPSSTAGNSIEVYLAGTNLSVPAPNIRACNGGNGLGNRINTNGDGRWCFEGSEGMYEVKQTNGDRWLWYPTNEKTGFINVKDFRPVSRTSDGQYIFSEPRDWSKTFKNAIQFLTSRQGGTLNIPDGDYVLGTTDGNQRDPNYRGLTLSSGINIIGAGANSSVPSTNLPNRFSPTRLRLRNSNQAIFRIGGCTNQVSIRGLELVGNAELANEAKRDTTGNYGIEGIGMWAKNARTGAEAANSSQMIRFENLTIQGMDKGIFVHNINDDNCNDKIQACKQWHFDYVRVESSMFLNNKTGIWIDTQNTDWVINNSVFAYLAQNGPGDGIRLKNTGSMLIQQTFGGGYNYDNAIGGTFIYVDSVGTLMVMNSGSERGKRTLYTNPAGAISNQMITFIGGVYGDPIELHGNLNFVSIGNLFTQSTIQADPGVVITSTGDHFCYDPRILPGRCVDQTGRATQTPDFKGGRMMFQTGRLPEGSGNNRIEGRPNIFGYDLEMRNGLIQYDPNVTFADLIKWANGQDGHQPVKDGAFAYCKDCQRGGECRQGVTGRDGSFAKRINGRWQCD